MNVRGYILGFGSMLLAALACTFAWVLSSSASLSFGMALLEVLMIMSVTSVLMILLSWMVLRPYAKRPPSKYDTREMHQHKLLRREVSSLQKEIHHRDQRIAELRTRVNHLETGTHPVTPHRHARSR